EADAMRNMLVHGPALQPVQVLVSPLVTLRQELHSTVFAPIAGCSAADHLPADAARRELEVIGQFRVRVVAQAGDAVSLAVRTSVAPKLDLSAHRQPRSLSPIAVTPAGPPDQLAGAEVDLLPLIVEPGAAVNVVEIRDSELDVPPLAATRRGRDLIRP